MDKETTQEQAWCFDVRTGWAQVEDVVWAGCPVTDEHKALSRAGFNTEFLNFGKDSFTLEFQVYQSSQPTGPQFYVRFVADDNTEHFYLANLPSLLAWLKDAAPIFQAGLVSDLISPDFGDSIMDNLRAYVAGMARAGRRGRR